MRPEAKRWLAAALFAALVGSGPARAAERGAAPNGDAEALAAMAEIVAALGTVLPLSLSDARYADPASREKLLAALRELAGNGARLEAHGRDRGAGFGFLAGSLARDSAEILRRYEEERFAESRFLLHQLTDNCVACNSRLPDAKAHPLGRTLFEDPAIAQLPPEERVELEVATRQFDSAIDTYEALFAAPGASPTDLDLLGALDGYLELCLRVQGDPKRPATAFEKLAARDDTSPPLRAALLAWVAALGELAEEPAPAPSLAAARALLEAARDSSRFPDDRRALVPYVAASGLLHRYVAGEGRSAAELGEAYYWLGFIEAHVGRAFWLSQTEHFLEASIRTAPGEPSAENAFVLLEEFVVSGYTGSAGVSVPEDVRARFLERFRSRVNTAGEVVIVSQRFRDRGRNCADCVEKLRHMLAEAAVRPTPRRATRPTRSSVVRRVADKRRRSVQKRGRRAPRPGDEE